MRKNRRAARLHLSRAKTFLTVLATALFAGGIYWFVFLSPYLQIREITVEGFNPNFAHRIALILEEKNQRFTPFFVYEIFPQSLENNKSYAAYFLSHLGASLLRQYPEMEDVAINANVRNSSLSVRIKQREIDFLWCEAEEKCYYLDKNGVIFKEAIVAPGTFLRKIVAVDMPAGALGSRVVAPDDLERVAEIFRLADDECSPLAVQFVEIQSDGALNIATAEGFYVLSDLSADFTHLWKVLAKVKEQYFEGDWGALEYLNCRYLPKIYCRRAES